MNVTSGHLQSTFVKLFNQAREKFFGSFSQVGAEKLKRTTEDIANALENRRVIDIGDKIPVFELVNFDGVLLNICDELDKNHIVLSFYRGAWCPFCNLEIQMLQSRIDEIRGLGANIVAISPQSPDYSILFKARHHIQFPVLSDTGNEVARLFGLEYDMPPEACDILQHELGLDFTEYNADSSEILPVPATYVVARTGVVRHAFINPDYTQRLDPDVIIEELKKL